jgi:fucose permease
VPFFGFYVASEIGVANWVSPFASLLGLASEADAALLATAFYACFALTRLLAAPLSRRVPSSAILWGGLLGALASAGLLYYSGQGGGQQQPQPGTGSLWASVGALGFFMGPLWPAWQGLLVELYGVRLRAGDMALALAASKVGMAGEQFLFSWLLAAGHSRARMFPAGLLMFLLACVVLAAVMLRVVLPLSGLIRVGAAER